MFENPLQLERALLGPSRLLLTLKINPRTPEAISVSSRPLPIIRKSPCEITSHVHAFIFDSLSNSAQIAFEEVLSEDVVDNIVFSGRRSPVIFAFCGGAVLGDVDGGVVAGPDPG